MKTKVLLFIVVLALVIIGCGGGSEPEAAEQPAQEQATETPVSEATPADTPVSEATPTDTPEPTETPEPTATPEPERDWVEFSSAEGGFMALFPTKPAEQTQTAPTAAGDIEMQIFMAPQGDEAIFGVMYNDFPLDISSASPEEFEGIMNSGRDSALANMGGELVSEESVSLGEYPGRHIIFEIPDDKLPGGGKGVLRAYLVENRLYQLIALGSHEGISDEDMEFFIDSFELIAP